MTPDKTPTDAEIEALARSFIRKVGSHLENDDAIPDNGSTEDFARAVLAKWGSPVVAGEPVTPDFYTACAWHEGGGVGGWIALPGYSNETERGVKHLVLEAARKEGYKGTAAGRLLELGWEIRPVYLTPQPTQAQAGAVTLKPLDHDDVRIYARNHLGDVAEESGFIEGVRWAEDQHGIKGGQHGTE